MIQRCTNPKHDNYAQYGGRGITVCQRWLASIENFIADLGERPSLNLTLDREDPNGNYEPGNCVWANKAQQSINRRQHHEPDADPDGLNNF